jgi:hypothetical protein
MTSERGDDESRSTRTERAREVFEAMLEAEWEESVNRQLETFPVLSRKDLEEFLPAFNAHLERHWPEWEIEAEGYSEHGLEQLIKKYGRISAAAREKHADRETTLRTNKSPIYDIDRNGKKARQRPREGPER